MIIFVFGLYKYGNIDRQKQKGDMNKTFHFDHLYGILEEITYKKRVFNATFLFQVDIFTSIITKLSIDFIFYYFIQVNSM